jgi:hypothetical protein
MRVVGLSSKILEHVEIDLGETRIFKKYVRRTDPNDCCTHNLILSTTTQRIFLSFSVFFGSRRERDTEAEEKEIPTVFISFVAVIASTLFHFHLTSNLLINQEQPRWEIV